MTAGTKIFLAIVALIVVILVVYYGWMLPVDEADLVLDDAAPEREVLDDPAPRRAEPEPRREPPSSTRLIPDPPSARTPRELDSDTDPVVDDGSGEVEPNDPDDADDPDELVGPPDSAIDPDAEGDLERTRDPLEDHAPVDPARAPADDGGKDGPAPQPDPEDDAADRDEDEADEPVAPAEPERPRVTPPDYTMYTVRSGDTMSSIAQDWFGDAGKWDLIAKANPFVDPNRLAVGDELRLPPRDAEREEIEGRAGDRPTVYRVRSGDNLSKIARSYYGNSSLWRIIYEANRPTIGPDPARLKVGMELTIPPAPQPADEDD